MKREAIEKIEKELRAFKGGNKESAVKESVAAALKEFAGQDQEFAQAIVQSEKTLSDCCAAVMKGVGNSISDHEVYRRAVQFYFKGADVRFQMVVEMSPAQTNGAASSKPDTKVLTIEDFF